jgi:tetraprenyl-beta-curcumene synthase
MSLIAFAQAVPRYWLSVYPQIRVQRERQRRSAAAIPASRLRGIALSALQAKRTNIEGAGAFAAFVPASRRRAVLGAQVAFQALYDYLDSLTEEPHADPVGYSRRLHGALAAALRPAAAPAGTHDEGEDGGYTAEMIGRCRACLCELPRYEAMQPSVARLAQHIVSYQSFNVSDAPEPQRALERWARQATPGGSGLRWWETAASAGSSLGLFALIALAASPTATVEQARAIERAYFPWVGALHSLLDSLIDAAEDAVGGQQSLIERYGSEREAAARLTLLARESLARVSMLPDAGAHAAILASMAGLYLAEPQARGPRARRARRQVLRALGGPTLPAMLIARLRRRVQMG